MSGEDERSGNLSQEKEEETSVEQGRAGLEKGLKCSVRIGAVDVSISIALRQITLHLLTTTLCLLLCFF